MDYKKDFTGDFDLFMDRMSYVYEEYIKLMRGKKPDIGIGKTMGQYFMTFMLGFIEECKANGIDHTNREQVFEYFDKFSREPHVQDQGYKYSYWSDRMDQETGKIELTEQEQENMWFD